MTHAVIYDRASTKKQKDNFSRVNAHDEGIKIAEREGYTYEYVQEIGSGTTLTGRPEMMKILDRIAAGEIQVLIVQDLDRLARPEEAVVYSTIRQVIMAYNVIIHTHTARIDLNDDADDFTSDILMSVAKKERRTILKRMRRSKVAKAEAGGYAGGGVGLGYKLVYDGKNSNLVINEAEVQTVKAIFDILEATGGNVGGTAKKLNELGYTTREGQQFVPSTIKWIAGRKMSIGIVESALTDKVIHRPDLQIISVAQFERVQELIKSRAGNKRDLGRRGHYVLTGFITCGGCKGHMVATNSRKKGVFYQCATSRLYGIAGCAHGTVYSEHLILPSIIEFLAGFIQSQNDFYEKLAITATQINKSVIEQAHEARISGELASIKAGKDRIIEAISLGITTNQEAAAKLAELREQEQGLMVELSSIAEKTKKMEQWQDLLKSLEGKDITQTLTRMAEMKPINFRRLLSIVFKPNSLRVRTERIPGSKKWRGKLEGYKITEALQVNSLPIGQLLKSPP